MFVKSKREKGGGKKILRFFLRLFCVVNYSFVVQFFSHHYYILSSIPRFLNSILFHSEIIFEYNNNNNNLLRTLIIGDPNNNNNNNKNNNNNNYPLCVWKESLNHQAKGKAKGKKIQFRFTKNMMMILTIAMIPIYSLLLSILGTEFNNNDDDDDDRILSRIQPKLNCVWIGNWEKKNFDSLIFFLGSLIIISTGRKKIQAN